MSNKNKKPYSNGNKGNGNNRPKNNGGKPNNSNRNGRKPKNQGKPNGETPDDKWSNDESKVGHNDVSWYVPDVQLLNDAGRWPYSRPVGTPLSRNSLLGIADITDAAVPGLCVAHTYITPGNAENGQSAINVAANAAYTYVRHINSGSRNYDANDLMIYIAALDSIYAYVTWVTRLYATVGMYASMNKYLPDALGRAQSVDLGSIRDNMANFRSKFNALLLKIGTLIVPNNMPIFKRHAFLFQNYYSEGPSIKDQIYFHTLENVYKFQLDSSGAGMLKNVEISDYWNANNLLDASGIIRILEDLISPIFNDEDFNIMSGDILKAYDGQIMGLMLLPDLLVAQPINNVVFLEQFKNMSILSTHFTTASGVLDITQDAAKEYLQVDLSDVSLFRAVNVSSTNYDSAQVSMPAWYRAAYDEWSRPRILTTELQDVTPEVNMLNTRNLSCPEIVIDASKPSGLAIQRLSIGSEVVGWMEYYYYDKLWNLVAAHSSTVAMYDSTDLVAVTFIANFASVVSSFRFHPQHIFIGIDESTSPATYSPVAMPIFGIDNFTTIDVDHISTLNDVAILGEYNVPRLAIVK